LAPQQQERVLFPAIGLEYYSLCFATILIPICRIEIAGKNRTFLSRFKPNKLALNESIQKRTIYFEHVFSCQQKYRTKINKLITLGIEALAEMSMKF
jgi:hypothetical protein